VSVYLAPPAADPSNALASVEAASSQAEQAVAQCSLDSPDCIADVFDAYAAALRELAPHLPPQLRSLPTIVARAANKIRASRSSAEAVKAIKVAIAEVRKSITLLRADDGLTRQAGTREGSLVAQTLQVADAKLESAVGL
jgi:hypothetical protein